MSGESIPVMLAMFAPMDIEMIIEMQNGMRQLEPVSAGFVYEHGVCGPGRTAGIPSSTLPIP